MSAPKELLEILDNSKNKRSVVYDGKMGLSFNGNVLESKSDSHSN